MAGYFQKRLEKLRQKEKPKEEIITLSKRCRIIAPATYKGGVAKTTTMVNLATCLANMGSRVLLIDLDDSGGATNAVGGMELDWEYSIADVLEGKVKIGHAPFQTTLPIQNDGTLWFIGSDDANKLYSTKYGNNNNMKLNLRTELDKLRGNFDFILIDPPPTLEFWLFSAIYAADYLITPIMVGSEEVKAYFKTKIIADDAKSRINPALEHLGVFFTSANTQSNIYKDVKSIFEAYPGVLFETEIPTDIKIKEAYASQLPVPLYSPKSKGSLAYQALAKEVLLRCQQNELH